VVAVPSSPTAVDCNHIAADTVLLVLVVSCMRAVRVPVLLILLKMHRFQVV